MMSLSRDLRKVMEPFTASNLQEKKSNKIKDFVSLSGIFHVSHMCLLTRSEKSMSMKIARLPQGPTITFKVHSFILTKDVLSSLKKQFVEESAFQHAPLVILNGFSGHGNHMKLMTQTFQNMFPAINLNTIKLNAVRRCVLFSYNPASNLVDMRHYAVTLSPAGINKGIKKLVMKKIPDMSKFEDVGDFIMKSNLLSDSEVEDDETHVTLSQTLKKGNLEGEQSAVRLYELGPRITFELSKVESELLTGEVLYHKDIVKSADEILKMKKRRADRRVLKEIRKKTQEDNKVKKDRKKEEHRLKTGNKDYLITESDKRLLKDAEEAIDDEPEDDVDYYKEEIGENPDKELFGSAIKSSRKRPHIPKFSMPKYNKKPRLDNNNSKGTKDKRNNDGKKFKRGNNKGGSSSSKNNRKKNFKRK
jgi:ribosome biogenesis protein SSF1/2